MQKSSLCSTPQDGQAQKSLCSSMPGIITPPLSENYKDSTAPKTKTQRTNQSYLYQINRLSSMKISAKYTRQPAAIPHLGPKMAWFNLGWQPQAQYPLSRAQAWGWQSSKSGATIPKSFGFEAATRYRATNQCYPESGLFEPCQFLGFFWVLCT